MSYAIEYRKSSLSLLLTPVVGDFINTELSILSEQAGVRLKCAFKIE